MKTSKSSLFLMELIIALLFFALSSAVCIQLFVKAHLLSQTTINQNNALLWCQNIAELYTSNIRNCSDDSDTAINQALILLLKQDKIFSNSQSQSSETTYIDTINDGFALYFDNNWEPGSKENHTYIVLFDNLGYNEQTHLYEADVSALYYPQIPTNSSMNTPEQVVYSLHLTKYIPEVSLDTDYNIVKSNIETEEITEGGEDNE